MPIIDLIYIIYYYLDTIFKENIYREYLYLISIVKNYIYIMTLNYK